MASANPKTLFDIPIEDILVDNVGQYLRLKDIYNLRMCSKDCEIIADSMAAAKSFLRVPFDFPCCERKPPSGDVLSWILQNCRRLKTIELGLSINWWRLKMNWLKDFISELLINNPQLESFSSFSYKTLSTELVLPLATHCKKLKQLSLHGYDFHGDFLCKLAEHNNQLREVDFSWSILPSDDDFPDFFKKQPHLEYIDLKGICITRLNATLLTTIGNGCPKVKTLNIQHVEGGVNKAKLKEIKEKCPKILTILFEAPYPSESSESDYSDYFYSDYSD
ncbi:uncharacterized protein LOC129804786 [Phlebotomus papatasi]|uniref:uncharacterized protein LOC129804786 n=1 Tax=Phlebotomus papatasi TaxID=29031 RepID=UPI0024840644|nr:uncharacterized protein LOC129804786 [Phlebotomus papatasi]